MQIGRHIGISDGFTTAPGYAASTGCNFMQIFLASPKQNRVKQRTEKELLELKAELKSNSMRMVIHGSYMINLCHRTDSPKFKTGLKLIEGDLKASSIIGLRCIGVIIHMGKNVAELKMTDDEAIQSYIEGVQEVLAATPPDSTLILETGASQGTEVGSRITALAQIYNGFKKKEKARIKFCIDTCHIFATGYCISDKAGVKAYFKKFDAKIGIDKIACFHFNDSKTDCGSNVDRHADIGYGFIDEEGLKAVAKFAVKHDIPIVMETPLDAINPKTGKEVTFKTELAKVKAFIKI